MSETLKHRLVGALVLLVGAVVLLPIILGSQERRKIAREEGVNTRPALTGAGR